jgi:hypothetical protein
LDGLRGCPILQGRNHKPQLGVAQYWSQRTGDAFLARMGLRLTGLSAVALAWVDLAFLLIPVCGGQ